MRITTFNEASGCLLINNIKEFIGNESLSDHMDTCFIESGAVTPSIGSIRNRRAGIEKRESVAQITLNTISAILHGYERSSNYLKHYKRTLV